MAASLAAATGRVSIESQPGVEVVWDGTSLGHTDAKGTMLVEGIPIGEYVLEMKKTGYRSQSQRLVVTEEPAVYHGYLEQLDSVVPLTSPEPVAASEKEVPPAPPLVETDVEPITETETADTFVEDSTNLGEAGPGLPPPVPDSQGTLDTEQELVAVEEPSPAAQLESSDDSGHRGLMQLLLALGIALAGSLAIFFTGRRSASIPTSPAHGPQEIPFEKAVSVDDDSGFIESLKQREQALDDSSGGPRQVIDVEVIDVQEIEGDA